MADRISPEVQEYLDLFECAYEYVTPYFEEAKRAADAYNRKINHNEWNTLSELVIPLSYIAVEQMLPTLFEYLFPRFKWLTLVPRNRAIPGEVVENFEEFLADTLYNTMQLRQTGTKTLKDMLKYGVGYTAVEAKTIRPEVEVLRVASNLFETIATSRAIAEGPAITVPSSRHIPFGSVVPLRGGDSPGNVPGLFWVDFVYEHNLRAMYEEDAQLGKDDRIYMGSVDEIVKDSYKFHNSSGRMSENRHVIAYMANQSRHPFDAQTTRISKVKNIPGISIIPILKFEAKGEHKWFANGRTLMYEQVGGLNTMRSTISKCSGWPDSDQWFTPGIIGPREDMDRGTNEFYNAFFDILNYHLHPARVINRQMVRGDVPTHEPYAEIESFGGDWRQAVGYIEPPRIDPGFFSIGQVLQDFGARASGQPLATQGQGSPGLLRGGAGAFESMLQGTYSREKMIGAVAEIGWLESVIYKTISILQTFVSSEGVRYIAKMQNESGKYVYAEKTVTEDEIRTVYDVRLDLGEKHRNSTAEETIRTQKYDRMVNDPYYDQVALRKFFLNNRSLEPKLLLPEDQARQVEEQARQMTIQMVAQAQAQQVMKQQELSQAQGGMTRGEQALAGGASQVEGLQ